MKIKSDIGNIPIEKHRLPNMHWIAMMHKNPFKAKFIIVSPKSSIKPLARAITSVFRLFFRQMQTYNNKSRFFYGARCVKNIKDNVICLNKQQIKDAVAYLLNCYFTVDPKIFCQIIGIPMGSDPAPFLPTYSYTSMKVSGWTNLRRVT